MKPEDWPRPRVAFCVIKDDGTYTCRMWFHFYVNGPSKSWPGQTEIIVCGWGVRQGGVYGLEAEDLELTLPVSPSTTQNFKESENSILDLASQDIIKKYLPKKDVKHILFDKWFASFITFKYLDAGHVNLPEC